MSEPDNPRWLEDIEDELRADVPVRAAWRADLLDDVARAPRPAAGDRTDDRFDAPNATPAGRANRRSIVLSPLGGIAAAFVFAALGGGVTYRVMSLRAPHTTAAGATTAGDNATGAAVAASASSARDRETVRFELAAPQASRVSLVGSFNEWNPRATPLVRDASSGKWIASVRLPPGRHVYAFVVDGDVTADPAAPRAADDDFGSKNSVVLVAAPRT
jgi:hypothetical protein